MILLKRAGRKISVFYTLLFVLSAGAANRVTTYPNDHGRYVSNPRTGQ